MTVHAPAGQGGIVRLVLCLIWLSVAMAADISQIRGEVGVRRAGSSPSPLKKGDRIGSGDLVWTGSDGFARIELRDKSVVTLGPNSRYLLSVDSDAVDKEGSKAMVVSGSARLDLSKIKKLYVNKDESYKVYTPTAVCGVRGTEFTVQSDRNGRTRTAVTEGEIAVSGKVLADDARVSGGASVSKGQGFSSDLGGKVETGKPSLQPEKELSTSLSGKPKPDAAYEAYYLELLQDVSRTVLSNKAKLDGLQSEIKQLSDLGEALVRTNRAPEAAEPAEKARVLGLKTFILRKEILHRINQYRGYATLLEHSGKTPGDMEAMENLWYQLTGMKRPGR